MIVFSSLFDSSSLIETYLFLHATLSGRCLVLYVPLVLRRYSSLTDYPLPDKISQILLQTRFRIAHHNHLNHKVILHLGNLDILDSYQTSCWVLKNFVV
jgi:hypothetical protein